MIRDDSPVSGPAVPHWASSETDLCKLMFYFDPNVLWHLRYVQLFKDPENVDVEFAY